MSTAVPRIATSVMLMTGLATSGLFGQSAVQTPEYFGFYARDAGKLIAVGGGRADTPPTLRQLSVAVLGASQPAQRAAVEVSGAVRFLLFDASPSEAARALSIYRLPFVQSEITVSDVAFLPGSPPPNVRARNMPGVMRLAASQIRLLQKPVSAQPQMIELVPDPELSIGVYGVLFAPATSVAVGGIAAGQTAGWTAILIVGETSAAVRSGECINLVLTGGLGGMIGIDSPDRGRIAGFPLLDAQHAQSCSTSSSAPSVAMGNTRPPLAVAGAPSAITGTVASHLDALERGEDVVFRIRYTDSSMARALAQQDGVITVNKKLVRFQPSVGSTPFSVEPKKIVDLINEPAKANRIRLKVLIPNKKGDKEDNKSYEFYHPSTFINGLSISCARCDDSMTTLYQVLSKAREY